LLFECGMRRPNTAFERFGCKSDPRLLPRIRDLKSNGEYLDAEEIAYDLQQKYPEYSRRKFRDFVRMVQWGMDRLEIDAEGVNESGRGVTNETGSLQNGVERVPGKRKRKLIPPCKSEPIITLADSDSDGPDFERYVEDRGANLANKALLKLYGKKENDEVADKSAEKIPKISKRKSAKRPAVERDSLGNTPSLNIHPEKSSVMFADLGGCEAQFLDVCRLSMHLKHPEIHERLGVQPPRGFLLHGPPGCGKTLFAQAVAGLASTELVSGVSGESEDKIRQLFARAVEVAPCVLLLDQIDAIAPKREIAHREMERRIVSQLLTCLDDLYKPKGSPLDEESLADKLIFAGDGDVGLKKSKSDDRRSRHVLVIGTTNRPESLESALRRAGRFDKEIALGIPDERARTKILEIVCRGIRMDESVKFAQLARLTPGYVGADLKALAREASMCAVNRVFETVVQSHTGSKRLTAEETEEELRNKLILIVTTFPPFMLTVQLMLLPVLAWLKSEETLDDAKLDNLFVILEDFKKALTIIHPSAKREGFVTVPDVSWQDIGALKEVREELQWSILYPIKRPEDFELLAIGSTPQGILLCGPPGCGKTLLAKAVANETGMNFISVKGPELLSMYVGESERAVRTVFQRARDSSPCVIFFDEIDALCPKRSLHETSGGARLVNQLLTEMDGIECRKQVFLIAATNRPDIVDPAILRPGRLDKVLFVDFPTVTDREDILRKATKDGTRPRVAPDVSYKEIAADPALEWFTGADLVALVHEASVNALKERLSTEDNSIDALTMKHFRLAMQVVRPSVADKDRANYQRLKELYAKRS
uniref:Nuclear valosin-containing protein-like n=1 Tax=Toxocara canis TaxID=6265 RepID=A0A183UV63_TOXCA